MTLLRPSHPLCYQGSSGIFVSWGARGTQRTCLSQDGRGPVGSQWSSRWVRCTRPLTHRRVSTSCASSQSGDQRDKLCKQGGINLDQTLPGPNPEDAAAVIISDDDETDFPVDTPQAVSTPKVEPAWNQKRSLEDRSPCSSPPKKQATEEKEESPPPHEAVLP